MAGITEIEAEDVVEAKGPGPMSSQVRQPFQTLELPPKSWPQIPWRADQRLASFQNLPLRSGMVAGFWVWIFGGFFRKCTVLRFGAFCKKIRRKSAPKIRTPSCKTRARIRTKIRTQNPQQNPRQALDQYPQRPTTERAQGVSLSYTLLLLAKVSENPKKSHQNPLRDSGGNLMATEGISC